MRINLNVPFALKDEAKSYGAKWDGIHKTWFFYTEDVSPDQIIELMEFMPKKALRATGRKSRAAATKPASEPKQHKSRPVATPHTDFSLPACGCTHAPPWEICCDVVAQAHDGIEQLDPDQREHMRSILSS